MPDFKVQQRGTDSSGRPIFATNYMWGWWLAVCAELGFTPTITQGAFMKKAGGGAAASAGYHDLGACFDLRVWDLTQSQVEQAIRTLRRSGAAAWLRNEQHGGFSDPHIHLVLGSDAPLAPGASWQFLNYLGGGDGMGGRDYHDRPNPLVTEPPASLLEDDMAQYADQLNRIEKKIDAARKRDADFRKNTLTRLKKLERATKDDVTKRELRELVESLSVED